MSVVVGILKLHSGHVWLDLADVKEHLVNLIVLVDVGTAKIVTLSDGLIHLKAVHDSESDII